MDTAKLFRNGFTQPLADIGDTPERVGPFAPEVKRVRIVANVDMLIRRLNDDGVDIQEGAGTETELLYVRGQEIMLIPVPNGVIEFIQLRDRFVQPPPNAFVAFFSISEVFD